MRIAFYTQNVLGVGHLFRSLEVVRALSGHRVGLITGGPEVKMAWPGGVEHCRLPGLRMDDEFNGLLTVDPGADLEEVKQKRTQKLLAFLERFKPRVFLAELYPFGRRAFRFELVPALEMLRRQGEGRALCVTSVRDILVEKSDPEKYQGRVIEAVNRYFDAVLVHADPHLVRLKETFPRLGELKPPLYYTGYVTPKPPAGAGPALRAELGLEDAESLLVASAGSGAVGGGLMQTVLEASARLSVETPHRLVMFTGPHLAKEKAGALAAKAAAMPWVRLSGFSGRFPAWLAAADLSISLAGYNTTMNLLAAKTQGLMLPFDQNREQRMRAERLEEKGLLKVLNRKDLEPARLAGIIRRALAGKRGEARALVDLNGAAQSAAILAGLAEGAKTS